MDCLGQIGLAELLLDLPDVVVTVALAERLLDGALLLPQQLFALLLVQVLTGLAGDFLAQFHHGSLVRQLRQHEFQQLEGGLRLEDLLLVRQFDDLLREARDTV